MNKKDPFRFFYPAVLTCAIAFFGVVLGIAMEANHPLFEKDQEVASLSEIELPKDLDWIQKLIAPFAQPELFTMTSTLSKGASLSVESLPLKFRLRAAFSFETLSFTTDEEGAFYREIDLWKSYQRLFASDTYQAGDFTNECTMTYDAKKGGYLATACTEPTLLTLFEVDKSRLSAQSLTVVARFLFAKPTKTGFVLYQDPALQHEVGTLSDLTNPSWDQATEKVEFLFQEEKGEYHLQKITRKEG